MVLGLQGGPAGALGADTYLPSFNASIIAQAKHFAGYGHAAGGINGGVADMSNRTLLDVYLRPWRSMVAAAGLRSAMVSHQTVHDVPAHANAWLINGVLRGDYGFGGFTISDEMDLGALGPWGWAVSDNISQAAAIGLRAGVDIDLQSGGDNGTMAYAWLPAALDEGLIDLADLQTAAGHVLTMKFAAGLFDSPLTPEAGLAVLNSPQHRALALDAARQGIVLAINQNGTLPLTPSSTTRIALLGPLISCNFTESVGLASAPSPASRLVLRDPTPDRCSAREAMVGAYALDDGQVDVPLLPEALVALLPPGASVTVTQGASVSTVDPALIPPAVAAAAAADVAIIVIGDTQATCAEGVDRRSLDVSGGQLALLQVCDSMRMQVKVLPLRGASLFLLEVPSSN